jgi:cytidine deaminase
MATITPAQRRNLVKTAKKAASRAYAPYSKFRVGAAVLTSSGKIYAGCNVENASYGLCNCAERTAIFTAVAAGETEIECIAVYTPTEHATPPCGACRQVINEFGPDAFVISTCETKDEIETSLEALLPAAFGPGSL